MWELHTGIEGEDFLRGALAERSSCEPAGFRLEAMKGRGKKAQLKPKHAIRSGPKLNFLRRTYPAARNRSWSSGRRGVPEARTGATKSAGFCNVIAAP